MLVNGMCNKMTNLFCFLLVTLSSIFVTEAYKILVIFPVPSTSHDLLGNGIVQLLLDAGHEVHFITPFPEKRERKNLTLVDVSELVHKVPGQVFNIKSILDKEPSLTNFKLVLPVHRKFATVIYEVNNIKNLLYNTKINFDLVIAEWMFSELVSGWSVVYGCPFIWVSTIDPHWFIVRLVDEKLNPAYNTDSISQNIPPFGFYQRVKELWSQYYALYLDKFVLHEENVYKTVFGPAVAARGKSLPPYEDVIYNASLVLGNSHVSIGTSVRLPQNYKPIGGYHVDPTIKPLPEDLKKIMDNAKTGVIYFSMGSNLKSKDLPEEIKLNLLKMFGTLKQTVLWKFEEKFPETPSNVHILSWAPQASILAHPNCVLFITHGGLLSITETIHFGVPIIGIPAFADQFVNVDRAAYKGYAKRVDLSYTMHDDLKVAIEEITSNSTFHERVQHLSSVYHDRPSSPRQELIHWVEHVIRTGGAPQMRSPALQLSWYQKMYLDLAAVVLVILYIATRLFCLICTAISPLCRAKNPKMKKN